MKLASQVRTLFLVLVAIQVFTSLAGIALLARMSPAIGRILAENEHSTQAAEQMLAILASTPAGPSERARFLTHLRAAETNITERGERPALAVIRSRAEAALSGEPEARREVALALTELSDVNRAAMHRADEDARRLGLAGRWALALMALLGILASALAMRQARQKMLAPLTELVSVVAARSSGDRHRRYLQEHESELSRVLVGINELLDAADREPAGAPVTEQTGLRAAVGALLDRVGGRLLVVSEEGDVVSASAQALDLLAARGDEVRRVLRDGRAGVWAERSETIAGTPLSLIVLRAAPEEDVLSP